MTAKIQYNGMLLLASYVQRLFVAEQVKGRLEEESTQLATVKDYFDSINAIMPMFTQTKVLTVTQGEKLRAILSGVKDMMQHYFESLNTSYEYKLRIVTSSLFAEKLMVTGILNLGKIFNEDVGTDMKKREQFYEERATMMNKLVAAHAAGNEPTEQVVAVINNWFEGIIKQQDHILKDMEKMAPMIGIAERE
ncbi:hypothetical protein [Lysinibacillus sp. LZ02]|uniref:hypothetical protein n=1 Tax=Lysinibacillus sp. LZ02 TaxID=3420668 RepID=UPI003D361843